MTAGRGELLQSGDAAPTPDGFHAGRRGPGVRSGRPDVPAHTSEPTWRPAPNWVAPHRLGVQSDGVAAKLPAVPITITCDKCERRFEVDDEHAGGRAECPYCGDVNRIPAAAAAVGEAPVATGRGRGRPALPATAARPSRTATSAGATGTDEEVVAVVRQAMFRAHPFLYSGLVLLIVAGTVGAGLAAASVVGAWLVPAGLIVAGVGALALLGWWLAPHRWTKLVITNRRTIRQEGIVMRKTSEVLHHHVVNVVIEQSLLQRLLGVGYLGIDTAGQAAGTGPGSSSNIEIEVSDIPQPYEVKKLIDRFRLGEG